MNIYKRILNTEPSERTEFENEYFFKREILKWFDSVNLKDFALAYESSRNKELHDECELSQLFYDLDIESTEKNWNEDGLHVPRDVIYSIENMRDDLQKEMIDHINWMNERYSDKLNRAKCLKKYGE